MQTSLSVKQFLLEVFVNIARMVHIEVLRSQSETCVLPQRAEVFTGVWCIESSPKGTTVTSPVPAEFHPAQASVVALGPALMCILCREAGQSKVRGECLGGYQHHLIFFCDDVIPAV